MNSNTTTGDHGINGNLNVSNSLTSSGLTISSGNVDFTGATFTNNCIPSTAINGSSSNASTITVANDASLTITNGYIPYCGVTNNNVALKTNGGLRYNAMTGTLTTTLNGTASSANTSTTQASGDNSTNIATTAFVQNNILGLSSIYATISSLSNYLTTTNASSTYATISSLSNYLTTSAASSTYVSKANPTITGNLTLPSTFTTPGSGQLGYQMTGTNSGKTAISSGDNWLLLNSITSIPPGVWFLYGSFSATFGAITNFSFGLSISINDGGAASVSTLSAQATQASILMGIATNSPNQLHQSYIYTSTTTFNAYLRGRHNGGTAVTFATTGTFFAIRIA